MRPETRLQREMRKYLALKGYRTVAVPNGATLRGDAKDRAIQMANLKRDGLTPGFPDLIVFGKGGRVGFIEIKCEGNYQTASQKECERWLTEFGQPVAVCRSLADIDETINRWGWGQNGDKFISQESADSATKTNEPGGALTPPARDPNALQERIG